MTSQPDDTTAQPLADSTERTRAYRARLAAAKQERAETPPCERCGLPMLLGRIVLGSARDRSADGRRFCNSCWRQTPDGRAAQREKDNRRPPRRRSKQGPAEGQQQA